MKHALKLSMLLSMFAFNFSWLSAQNEAYDKEVNPSQTESATNNEDSGLLVRDGAYDRNIAKERKVLPYPPLREADIFWEKRVWRVIDTRQKMNQPFSYPALPFAKILLEMAKKYGNDVPLFIADEFTQRLIIEDLERRLGSVETISVYNPENDEYVTKVVKNDFDWSTVNMFRLKEDWMFDEQTSTMIVRILGIAPIRDVIDDNGNLRGQEAMFWAYYPSLRQYLVKYDVFNPANNAITLSWDDLFEMRHFASYIIKESNIYDRRISDYAAGRDALLESENIKKAIMEFEHNLWSY